MRRFAIGLLCVAWLLPAHLSAQSNVPPPTLSLPQYILTLDNSLAKARALKDQPQNAPALRDALPDSWHVQVDGKNFDIPTNSLRRELGALQATGNNKTIDQIIQQLAMLRSQAEGYEQTEPNETAHRALLNDILARREFRNVHGPTWIDQLKQRFIQWLFKLLGKAISSTAIPAISDFVVYGLILVAVLVLAYWMYRSLRESARLETIMPSAVPVSAKEWPLWLSEARAAASHGDWRNAVHLAYWGGISFLEAQGAWRPDAARTPREYLRLLPAASEHQPALRSLTQKLEHVWYGMQSADADSFQQTLNDLENLGCPCN